MKIALTFPWFHRRGGVERVVVECAAFLAGRGHAVSVVASQFDDGCLPAGVTAVRVAGGDGVLGLHRFATAAGRALAELKPDAHGSFGVVCPPGGVLWVQAVHAAWLDTSRRLRGPLGRLKQRANPLHPYVLHRERYSLAARRYAGVVALTPAVKADLHRFYAVPDGDVTVLPNGFNPAEFHPGRRAAERDTVRAELGYAAADRVVVFVANELERKGFGPLVRAVARLADPAVRLLAVGKLDPRAYAAEIDALGLSARVRYAGPSADVGRFYAAADAFALPTQYEAWGLVIVEALAAGLPVLTSRLAGAAVAVDPGRTGRLLNDPADVAEIRGGLEAVLSIPTSPADIAATVRAYAWPALLGRYEALLLASAGLPIPETRGHAGV